MTGYLISKKALADLRNIWNYTVDAWSEGQADVYFKHLIQAFEYIACNPTSSGHSYEDVKKGILGYHMGKHVIFYRILKSGTVRIVRVLHERMDYKRHF